MTKRLEIYKRICKRCNNIFETNSRTSRICIGCQKQRGKLNKFVIPK